MKNGTENGRYLAVLQLLGIATISYLMFRAGETGAAVALLILALFQIVDVYVHFKK